MEQKTRLIMEDTRMPGEHRGGWSKKLAVEMTQGMKILDAREGLELTEVPDAYLLQECEARGLIDAESPKSLMARAYCLAKEANGGRRVQRYLLNALIRAAYEAEGSKDRVCAVLGANTNTVKRVLEEGTNELEIRDDQLLGS